jgi:tyrosyl-tRNA synthetase
MARLEPVVAAFRELGEVRDQLAGARQMRDSETDDELKAMAREEIEALETETEQEPWKRSGQKRLADEVTTFVHGAQETEHAKAAAAALFGGGDLHGLSSSTLTAALREAGATTVPSLLPMVDLLVETGLAKSKGEARRTITEGGAYLNNVRIEDPDAEPQATDLIDGAWLVLRRGKKSFAGVEVG